jgi:nicotinamide-nucleotide amidase
MRDLAEIVHFLSDSEITLTTAESCTCGLIASLLGDIPGCGQVLDSALVVYSPSAKRRLLNVNPETIETYGLTSEEVASEMALGALNAGEADLAVANTGVADDSEEDQGGTQCYAFALKEGGRQVCISETRQFDGDRVSIRRQAARYALECLPERHAQLREKLRGNP